MHLRASLPCLFNCVTDILAVIWGRQAEFGRNLRRGTYQLYPEPQRSRCCGRSSELHTNYPTKTISKVRQCVTYLDPFIVDFITDLGKFNYLFNQLRLLFSSFLNFISIFFISFGKWVF
jgi:hypothetical protein